MRGEIENSKTHYSRSSQLHNVLHTCTLTGVGSIHMPGLSNSAYNTIGYPSAQRSYISTLLITFFERKKK